MGKCRDRRKNKTEKRQFLSWSARENQHSELQFSAAAELPANKHQHWIEVPHLSLPFVNWQKITFPCTEQWHPATSFGAVAHWILICYSTDFLFVIWQVFGFCVGLKSISLCDLEGISHFLLWVTRILQLFVTDETPRVGMRLSESTLTMAHWRWARMKCLWNSGNNAVAHSCCKEADFRWINC